MNDSLQPTRAALTRRNATRSRHARALRKLVFVFAGLSLIVLAATAYTYIVDRQELSADHIRQMTEAAGSKCSAFFQPVWSTASVIRQWGKSGVLKESRTEAFNAKLLPLLEQVPRIQAMRILSPKGQFIYGLMRRDGQWAACRAPQADIKNQKMTWQFYDCSGTKIERPFQSGPPDQTVQQRWIEVRDRSETYPLNWTSPYRLFPTDEIGMSAISGWTNGDQSLTFGFDFLMTDITQLLNAIKVTASTVLSASSTMASPGGASWWMPMKVRASWGASASLRRRRN